jgi:hypothetical protein
MQPNENKFDERKKKKEPGTGGLPPIILATQESEIRKIQFNASLGK